MTEFGGIRDVRGDLYGLNYMSEKMDAYQQSWMYWQFKYYQDLTTSTPVGEALYNNDGTVVQDKLLVLSRTYPMAVAGNIIAYSFYAEAPRLPNDHDINRRNGHFELTYQPWLSAASADLTSRTTEIYYNSELYYPYGVHVSFDISESNQPYVPVVNANIEVICHSESMILVVHTDKPTYSTSAEVKVTLTPCLEEHKGTYLCTCQEHVY